MQVTLQNLNKTFPAQSKKAAPVVAVNDVSLTIPDGKLLGLLGPSGCGKSTLLKLLLGVFRPSGGNLYLACGQEKLLLDRSTRRMFA